VIAQLQRLTRQLPAFGTGVAAIAVYSEATAEGMVERSAAESGFEGVACVDDAARLASLYIALWRNDPSPRWRTAALEMLGFVRAMQTKEGWFVNFIARWDGTRNVTGSTSTDPFGPWLARACLALVEGAVTFGSDECSRALARAMPWLDEPTRYLDIRAVALLAALVEHGATGSAPSGDRAERWADELYDSRCRGILPDTRGSAEIHLWGHLQECALAEAGLAFGRRDWVDAARESADTLLVPAAVAAFPAFRSIAFDVSCTVRGLDAVGRATGDNRYHRMADMALGWFAGRNAASKPVFDRRRGLVFDGIDGHRLNLNSGAESNIEAGLAFATSERCAKG
jgi:hypothetical protein